MQIYGVNGTSGTPNPAKLQEAGKQYERFNIIFKRQQPDDMNIVIKSSLDFDEVTDKQGRVIKKQLHGTNGVNTGYQTISYDGDRVASKQNFDAKGNLVSERKYSYNEDGSYTMVYTGEFSETRTFDAKGRLLSSVDENFATFYEYPDENAEKPSKEKFFNPSGKLKFVVEKKYDDQGREVEERFLDADGKLKESVVKEYSGDIETKTSFDKNGKVNYQRKYDTVNKRTLEKVGFNGSVSKYKYNEDGSYTVRTIDSKGKFEQIEKYNDKGKLIEEKHADGTKILHYYDNNGRPSVEKKYDSYGELTTTKHEYNKQGQEIREIEQGSWGTNTSIYKYDAQGNRSQAMVYDENGKFRYGWRTQHDKNGAQTGSYSVDENGKRLPEEEPQKTDTSDKKYKVFPKGTRETAVKGVYVDDKTKIHYKMQDGKYVVMKGTDNRNVIQVNKDGSYWTEDTKKGMKFLWNAKNQVIDYGPSDKFKD